MTKESWLILGTGQENFFFFPEACRLALAPTHPPVQWVTGALSSGAGTVLSHEADHSPLQTVKIKKCGVVPPLPTCHHGMHGNSFNLYTLLLFH